MTAARLLERLEGARKTGDDRWIARCPSHEDKSPSLAIRELPNGTVLLHDFAGCSALRVVQSVGLELREMLPRLLRLAHPDRHGNSQMANTATQWLLAQRERLGGCGMTTKLGGIIERRGQLYTVESVEPYVRLDGNATTAYSLFSHCLRCGDAFTATHGARDLSDPKRSLTRRCPACRPKREPRPPRPRCAACGRVMRRKGA